MRTNVFAIGLNGPNMVKITLSRRNLETLLAQLDVIELGDRKEDAYIAKQSNGTLIQVNGEEDELHYGGLPFGRFAPEIEQRVRRYRRIGRQDGRDLL